MVATSEVKLYGSLTVSATFSLSGVKTGDRLVRTGSSFALVSRDRVSLTTEASLQRGESRIILLSRFLILCNCSLVTDSLLRCTVF